MSLMLGRSNPAIDQDPIQARGNSELLAALRKCYRSQCDAQKLKEGGKGGGGKGGEILLVASCYIETGNKHQSDRPLRSMMYMQYFTCSSTETSRVDQLHWGVALP